MRPTTTLRAAAIALCLVAGAAAEEYSLGTAVEAVLRRNPGLESAAFRVEEARPPCAKRR